MINTNGFITEYIKSTQKILSLEKKLDAVERELVPIYKEIEEIMKKYNLNEKEHDQIKLRNGLLINTRHKEYYYFRSIIDGIYNLLKEFGWKYCSALFPFLEKSFDISIYSEEDFGVFYVDYICNLSPEYWFAKHELKDSDHRYLIYEEYESEGRVKIPVDLDIEQILVSAQNFLKDLHQLTLQKDSDAEYQEYLRLREKFG